MGASKQACDLVQSSLLNFNIPCPNKASDPLNRHFLSVLALLSPFGGNNTMTGFDAQIQHKTNLIGEKTQRDQEDIHLRWPDPRRPSVRRRYAIQQDQQQSRREKHRLSELDLHTRPIFEAAEKNIPQVVAELSGTEAFLNLCVLIFADKVKGLDKLERKLASMIEGPILVPCRKGAAVLRGRHQSELGSWIFVGPSSRRGDLSALRLAVWPLNWRF